MNHLIVSPESKQIFFTYLRGKKATALALVIVFCLPVLLYLQTVGFDFTGFDDEALIKNNIAFLSDFGNAPEAFFKDAFLVKNSPSYYLRQTSYIADIFYRPLQTLSFMVDAHLSGGTGGRMYHLTNVLLLGSIACLLFLLVRKFSMPLRLAVLSTLAYCAHPLFISSIAWLPARGDLLLVFFSLSSFLFFIEHLQSGRVVHLFLNWFAFTMALFCKETAAFLPFLFILYYFVFSAHKRLEKKYLLVVALYAFSGIVWFWLRSVAIGNFPNRNDVGLIPFISNLRTIPESLAKFILPFAIAPIPGFSVFYTTAGLIMMLVIGALLFINKDRPIKEKMFCLSWFLFLLLPTMLYKNEYYDYLNHRFFLPLMGLLLFVLFILPKKWFEKTDVKGTWLMVAICIFLSSVTFVKSRSYSDPLTFYDSVISHNPDNPLMYNNRGYVKLNTGDLQGAINDYTKALELDSKFGLAYYNRGNAYGAKGDLGAAINDYDKDIELNPNDADAYNNRGNACDEKGDHEKAINDFDKAIELNPHNAYTYNNRGTAYGEKGDLEKAINDFSKAVELNPDFVEAYGNRGSAYKAKNMLKEAGQDFQMCESLMKKKH